jgi:hypothetical protein
MQLSIADVHLLFSCIAHINQYNGESLAITITATPFLGVAVS